jgi:cellulose synthase/poly-beta-1,6-N-acetylglucosamine synthase-like glycosyltransferase
MIVSVAYFILYFSLFIGLMVLLVANRKRYVLKPVAYPEVSILIAARNEEDTILRCLQAIEQLDYPKDKIEVLIGDDNSTDATRAIVDDFIQNKPGYTCVTIFNTIGKARGKANVLAHLAKLAKSNYFFFTDADIAVPATWIEAMLAEMKPNIGVVTGITTISGTGFFTRLQAIDWLYALGLMQVVSDLKLPVTAMGNNMLLRREAYESVGGFESIEFSITEDIAIFNRILQEGWGFKNIYDKSVLALSTPAPTFMQFLHQRKRWMRGSMHLPVYMAFIFILHAAYYPVLLPFFAYTSVSIMVAIFVLKLLFQTIYIKVCLSRLNVSAPLWLLILFELYLVTTSVILILFFFMPGKTIWKGRKY